MPGSMDPIMFRCIPTSLFLTISITLLVIIPLYLDAYIVSLHPKFDVRCTITKTKQLFLTDKRVTFNFLSHQTRVRNDILNLYAENGSKSSDGTKKRRRRKQQQPTTVPSEVKTVSSQQQQIENLRIDQSDSESDSGIDDNKSVIEQQPDTTLDDLKTINEIANYKFQNVDDTILPSVNVDYADKGGSKINTNDILQTQVPTTESSSSVSNAIPLPDIKEARKRKQMEEEMARIQQEQDEQKVKIKRTDKEAFRKVSKKCRFDG
jgi:hypothetical protein